MKRAVLFDLFDTLIERDSSATTRLAGVPSEIRPAFGAVWQAWGERRMTAPVPYEDLLEEAFRQADVTPVPGRIRELAGARAATKARQLSEIHPEVIGMLKGCRRLGLKIAVVSGCAVDDVGAWNQSPLAAYVDVTAFSFEVGCNKPNRQIYDAAIQCLRVEAREAVFVDDMPECLDGARGAGIGTVVRAAWFVDRPVAGGLSAMASATSPAALLAYLGA